MPSKTKYRVEIDGKEVWSGTGDTYRVIPAEFRDRPADPTEGQPYPPAAHLYEDDELIGVQICLAEELAAAQTAGEVQP